MWGETAISKSISVILLTIIAVAAGGCGSSPEADAWQTTRIQPGGRVTGYPADSVSIGSRRLCLDRPAKTDSRADTDPNARQAVREHRMQNRSRRL